VAITLPTTHNPAVIAAIVVLTLLVFVGTAVWASRHLFRRARAERGFDEAVEEQRRRRR